VRHGENEVKLQALHNEEKKLGLVSLEKGLLLVLKSKREGIKNKDQSCL
jgi:hypothetical protein